MARAARIFVSYAHEDVELKHELDKHLAGLRRSGRVEVWSDRELLAGAEWERTVAAELEGADIILLLVSADFAASDFIWDEELRVALDRHDEGSAAVVPIILRSCAWDDLPFARLQVLPPDGRPVSDHDDRDRALTEVAEGIERLVDTVRAIGGAS